MDEMESRDDVAEEKKKGTDAAEAAKEETAEDDVRRDSAGRRIGKRRDLLTKHLDPVAVKALGRPRSGIHAINITNNDKLRLSQGVMAKLTPGIDISDIDVSSLDGLAEVEKRAFVHMCTYPSLPVLWLRELTAGARDRAEQVKAASARAAGLPWEMPPSGRRR